MQSPGRAVSDTEAPPSVVEREDPRAVFTRIAEWCRARGPYSRGLFAFFLYALTSILVFGLPVMGDLAHRCAGSCLPDTALYVWSFDWMGHALQNHLDPLFTDLVWAPTGVHLAWVTTLPGPSFLLEPLTNRFGGLVSVNILMLAAPALAAWATYLLCVRLTRRFWASLVGGFVFGFSTYINQHERAQLNLLLVFFVPLAVYLVVRRVEGSIGRIAFVVLLALALAGEFSTSTEVLATMTLFGGIAYLYAVLVAPMQVKKRLMWTVPLLASAYALGAALVSPIIFRLTHDAPPEHAIRLPEINSLDLLSFIVPSQYARFGGAHFASLSERFPVLPQNDTGYVGMIFVGILIWFTIQFRRQWWALLLTGFTLTVAILAIGPKLHLAGTTFGSLPGSLLLKLPLIKHATPDRFPVYLSLAIAVVTAIWIASVRGRQLFLRIGIAAIGIVLLSTDLAIEPAYHGTLATPSFFTDGTYRQYIGPGEVVFAMPYMLGSDLTWQTATDFDFRLARTYIGPIHPIGHLKAGLGVILTEPGKILPPPNAVRFFIEERQVAAVVAENPVPPEIVALMQDVLGTQPISIGDVTVWEVPPGGPTPHEPPPTGDVVTTAPSELSSLPGRA
jgi:hypothetical protein